MKRHSIPTLVASVAFVAVAVAMITQSLQGTASAGPAVSAMVARGEYLVRIMDCSGCHTPWAVGPQGPAPDSSRLLSGHPQDLAMPPAPALGQGPWVWTGAGTNTAFGGPWGVSFAANLTPDRETGLGTWDEATFIAAMRSGRHEGQGRPILPPMPWPAYGSATDEDLGAMFAYLQSIPAQRNRVPQPVEPAEVR